MLRVGLTGELGSGKSTVASLLAAHGAIILSSDEMARAMMQPGHAVYQAIVDHFGPAVLLQDGQLDRPALARLAFDPRNPRVEELNAIIHPAVLAEQERQLASINDPQAIVVIESALIFTTKHAGAHPWRNRFDRTVLVTAPEQTKISRAVMRIAGHDRLSPAEVARLEVDARARLAAQRIPDDAKADFSLANDGDLNNLRQQVDRLWTQLKG